MSTRGILCAPTATNTAPQLGGAGVVEVDDHGTTVDGFSEALTGLTPGTSYSYVGFATNSTGTAYTSVGNFTTLSTVNLTLNAPTITYGSSGSVTVTVASVGGTPGGNVVLTVDNGAPMTQPLTSGAATFQLGNVGAGDHTLAASYAPQGTFDGNNATGTLHVNQAPLTVTIANQTKVYGSVFSNFTGTITGLQGMDTFTPIYTSPGAAATAAVGSTYPITVTLQDPGGVLADYNVTTMGGVLTVTPAPLTIAANPQSKAYGANFTAFTSTITGLFNGDQINASYSSTGAAANVGIGTYPITVTPVDPGNVLSNYTVTTTPGTLTVVQAPLTISANNLSMVYGGTVPSLTVSYQGFVNGDSASVLTSQATPATTATSTSPAAGYTITVSGAAAANYAITYAPGTLSITPAPLTITAANASSVYGGVIPTFTVQYSGFLNGDTSASLSALPTVTTTASSFSAAGTYPITAGAAFGANYAITYAAGTLTVAPAPLTITAATQSLVYGTPLSAVAFVYSGFVNGDTAASLTTAPTASTTGVHVGSYPVTGTAAASPNYMITYTPGTLNITPAPLVIGAAVTMVYGAAMPTLTPTYTGLVNGDTGASLTTAPTLTTAATAHSPVGAYDITVAAAVDADYAITYQTGTLTITPAPLTVTASNQTLNVGDALPNLAVQYNGFVNGDTVASLTVPAKVDTTSLSTNAPGSFPLNPGAAVDANYAFSYVPGTLTVQDSVNGFNWGFANL